MGLKRIVCKLQKLCRIIRTSEDCARIPFVLTARRRKLMLELLNQFT